MWTKGIGILCCLFSFINVTAQQLPSHVERGNPIIPDMIADPSIVKIGDVYYCYATTDGYNSGLKTSGPPVLWQSGDLMNWSFKGIYFPSASGQLFWAPSGVRKVNGRYYLYPTVNRNIYVAVADRPEGPFKLANGDDTFTGRGAAKPVIVEKAPKGTKGIDAEVFVDDDGQAYLFWAQRGAAKLNKDMLSVDTATMVINTKRTGYSEGPIFFKRKGIYYYLYTLEGHENYKYAYGYSRSSPLGPFIFPEQDIIASTDKAKGIYGPGHGSVFANHQTGQYYFAYLEFGNGGANRQVWIDKLNFNADGTIKPVVLTHTGVKDSTALKKEINHAYGKKVSVSSVLHELKVQPVKDSTINRMETYAGANAVDESNGTRWMADTTVDKHASFRLDLGKLTTINRTEAYFVRPTAGHAYLLEHSPDGKNWKPYGGHGDVRLQSPHTDRHQVKTRYLRLTILKGMEGLWEFKVY
jgi:beta-xylosidase